MVSLIWVLVLLTASLASCLAEGADEVLEKGGFAHTAWVESTASEELVRIASMHGAFERALEACPEWQFYCAGTFDVNGRVTRETVDALHGLTFTSYDVSFSSTASRFFVFTQFLPEGDFVARRAALKSLVSEVRPDSVTMRGLFKRRSLRRASVLAQDVIDDVVCSNLRCGRWVVSP